MTERRKHARLKQVVVAVGLLLFATTLCMGISLLTVARVRTTEPYRHGVDLALGSPAVREALGEPLTVGRLPQGAVNATDGGEAQLNIPIRGPEGRASIRVNGTYRNGAWTYWAIRVDTEQGEHIDLLK